MSIRPSGALIAANQVTIALAASFAGATATFKVKGHTY